MGFLGDWWNSIGARQAVARQSAETGAKSSQQAGQMVADIGATYAGGPGGYLDRQTKAVEATAQKEAATSANLATKQALRGAKTAGMMGGQAALAASRQAADAYGGALAASRQTLRDQYTQGAGLQTGAYSAMAGVGSDAEKSRLEQRKQNIDLASKIMGGVQEGAKTAVSAVSAGGAGAGAGVGAASAAPAAVASDRRVKEDLEPASMSDSLARIKAWNYRYSGSNEPQTGVMAQDLEKGQFAPSVFEGADGVKRVDTGKLSLQNTAALSEHEKKLRQIESIIKHMESRGGSRG